jgi:hypothetical protein
VRGEGEEEDVGRGEGECREVERGIERKLMDKGVESEEK